MALVIKKNYYKCGEINSEYIENNGKKEGIVKYYDKEKNILIKYYCINNIINGDFYVYDYVFNICNFYYKITINNFEIIEISKYLQNYDPTHTEIKYDYKYNDDYINLMSIFNYLDNYYDSEKKINIYTDMIKCDKFIKFIIDNSKFNKIHIYNGIHFNELCIIIKNNLYNFPQECNDMIKYLFDVGIKKKYIPIHLLGIGKNDKNYWNDKTFYQKKQIKYMKSYKKDDVFDNNNSSLEIVFYYCFYDTIIYVLDICIDNNLKIKIKKYIDFIISSNKFTQEQIEVLIDKLESMKYSI